MSNQPKTMRTMKKHHLKSGFSLSPDGVNENVALFDRDKSISACQSLWGKDGNLIWGFEDAVKSGNAAVQLRYMRKHGLELVKHLYYLDELIKKMRKQLNRYEASAHDMHRKKWTAEEEEALITRAAEGDSIDVMAKQFGRTSQAIATKISDLVGVGRISQKVAGRFVGVINGIEHECEISGTVTREKVA